MRNRKEAKKSKTLAQRKHEKAIKGLLARCPKMYYSKRGKLRSMLFGSKDKKLQKLEDKIEAHQNALDALQKRIIKKNASKVTRTLRKRDKKQRGDKTPYRLIIIKDGVITEKDYDAPGFAKLHIPKSKEGLWSMDVVKFGKVEAKILDLDEHIKKNSDNTKELTQKEEQDLGRVKWIDDRAASFLSYHSLMVLAGGAFGFSMSMAAMWILQAIVVRMLS